ncbi:cytochrome P450 family protein [Abortiporus biennis]
MEFNVDRFNPTSSYLSVVLALTVLFLVERFFRGRRRSLGNLPPGPKGFPIIGNILDWPVYQEWFTFIEWGQKYGDIMSVSLLGQHMIVLNSASDAFNLLDQKGTKYSDRPVMMMGGELVGWSKTLALTRVGERFKEYRKNMHKLMGTRPQVVQEYSDLLELETHKFLQRTLKDPKKLSDHIRKMAASVILMMTYGYKVQESKDPLCETVDLAMIHFSITTTPGSFLVDVFPMLQYIPSWVPGASFKTKADSWGKHFKKMGRLPFQYVKDSMRKGTNIPNYVSNLLDTEELTPEKEDIIQWSAASIYTGAADTTVASIYAFYLAMTLYPDIQRKAQEEIDQVLGSTSTYNGIDLRLPTNADRDQLPYVNAVVSEVLRWHSVVPLGVPHATSEDDVYKGYFIPKGSVVIPNIWKMLHDPDTYHDPMTFKPERFLGENPERDPRDVFFGFGRRICPGRFLADSSIFLSCAMSLAVFDIRKVIKGGKEITPVVDYTTGTISHPQEFECSIKPRNTKAEALILSTH